MALAATRSEEETTEKTRAIKKGLRWVIFTDNPWIKRWDVLVLVCLFFLLLVLPFQIGVSMGFDLFANIGWLVVNVFVNAVLFVDTFIYFFRSYRDSKGHRVVCLTTIQRNYLRGWFVPYLISVMPYTLIFYFRVGTFYSEVLVNPAITTSAEKETWLLFFNLLKFIRLYRIPKIFSEAKIVTNLRMRTKSQITELVRYTLMIIYACHVFACIWCVVALLENDSFVFGTNPNWLTAFVDSNTDTNGELFPGTPDPSGVLMANVLDRYVVSLFWAIQTVTSIGYGNISPVTVVEFWMGSFLQLLAGIAWAYVIGGLVGIAEGFSARADNFRERSDAANTLISGFQGHVEVGDADAGGKDIIDKDEAALRIRTYVHDQYKNSENTSFANSIKGTYPIFDSLSPDLKNISSVLLYKQYLDKVPYLSSSRLTMNEQAKVAKTIIDLEFGRGEAVNLGSGEGKLGRGLFVLVKGLAIKTNITNASSRDKLIMHDTAVGVGKVLLEDGHHKLEGDLLKFLTYSQVVFIPRKAIMEAMEKNDFALWKSRGRWIYARTLLAKEGHRTPVGKNKRPASVRCSTLSNAV